jgi:positive regulator of sigma E activity
MNPEGVVVEVRDNTAVVELQGFDVCKVCEFYKFCNIGRGERKIICMNKIGAKIGDTVEVSTSDKNIFIAGIFNFLFPIILLIIGILAGIKIFKSEIISILIGVTLVVIYFIVFKYIDRKIIKSGRIIPKIVNIKRNE